MTRSLSIADRVNRLWLILGLLLVFGSIGAATMAYGVWGWLGGQVWDLIAVPVGFLVALFAFLLMAGLLYRVDRYRGVAARRIELFE